MPFIAVIGPGWLPSTEPAGGVRSMMGLCASSHDGASAARRTGTAERIRFMDRSLRPSPGSVAARRHTRGRYPRGVSRALALLLLVSVCWSPFAAAQQREGTRAAVTPVLETFDFAGVTLDGGPLRRQLDEVREYYLRIPNDDLLRPFRVRAGRPAPGAVIGGWC